jgi:hypothetical protein
LPFHFAPERNLTIITYSNVTLQHWLLRNNPNKPLVVEPADAVVVETVPAALAARTPNGDEAKM